MVWWIIAALVMIHVADWIVQLWLVCWIADKIDNTPYQIVARIEKGGFRLCGYIYNKDLDSGKKKPSGESGSSGGSCV